MNAIEHFKPPLILYKPPPGYTWLDGRVNYRPYPEKVLQKKTQAIAKVS